jgi:ATP-dependent exoDNAse (exonuclease V) beta subunit
LEGGSRVRISQWLDPSASDAALRGTILHACLAEIAWVDESIPDDDRLCCVVTEVLRNHGHAEEAAEWLTEFQRLLEQPLLLAQLSRGLYRDPEAIGFPAAVAAELLGSSLQFTVETERPFAAREPEGLLTGSIDRLVLLWDRDRIVAADILDFKTDVFARGDRRGAEERVAFYRPQMAAYRRAVAWFTRLPPERIASRLVFTSTGQTVNIV